VAYAGTHDNDTSLGWFNSAPANEVDFCKRYLNSDGKDVVWDMLKSLWASRANLVLATMQDFLSLDTSARMNFPGHPSGNWAWRLTSNQLNKGFSQKINELNTSNDRLYRQVNI
jgi:4-alpha-glucanotransferase